MSELKTTKQDVKKVYEQIKERTLLQIKKQEQLKKHVNEVLENLYKDLDNINKLIK